MESVHLSRLRNGVKIQFLNSVLEISSEFNTESLQVKPEVDNLSSAMDQVDASYKPYMGSEYTHDIRDEDKRRDVGARCLRNIAKAHLPHFNSEKSEAAETIVDTIDKYGERIYNLSLVEETTVLEGLVNDLESAEIAPKVSLLGLDDVVTEIKDSNNKFKTYWLLRSKESSGKSTVATSTLVNQAVEMYNKLEQKITAMQIVMPSNELSALAARLNDLVKRYEQMR